MGVALTEDEARVCMVHDMMQDLSPLATAYARARGQQRRLTFDLLCVSCTFI